MRSSHLSRPREVLQSELWHLHATRRGLHPTLLHLWTYQLRSGTDLLQRHLGNLHLSR